MLPGLYSAASALNGFEQNQDVLAQNLANASTPGYRRRGLSFESMSPAARDSAGPQKQGQLSGTRTGKVFSSFEPGHMLYTGNPLDVAVKGDSFFVLEGPKGPVYTRNGGFQVGPKGELQNKSGLPVSGASGRITIPPNVVQISIAENGDVIADKTVVGKLRLAEFTDLKSLTPVGDTLFAADPGVAPLQGKGKVEQGYREGSNVQVVNELVSMIAGMRQYEAAQKALHSLSDAVQQNTRPQQSA
jgi:flagellar basal-body rod protein FlgF